MTTLRKWMSFARTPLWRWKWLFLALLTASLGYGLFSASNDWSAGLGANFYRSALRIEHGWPSTYALRYGDTYAPLQRWTIWTHVQSFHVEFLLFNIAIAIGLSAAATYLAAWRFSRWQFRIGDILAATVVIAGTLGFAWRVEKAYQTDNAYLEELTEHSFDADRSFSDPRWQIRPLCDLGLVSREAANPIRIQCIADCGDEEVAGRELNAEQLLLREMSLGHRIFGPVESIDIKDHRLTDQGIAALAQWAPSCQQLEIFPADTFSDEATATIARTWPELRQLRIGSPKLTTESLRSLRTLRRLEKLAICDCSPEITPADLQLLDSLPNLKLLGVPESLLRQLTPEEKETWERRGVLLHEATHLGLSAIEWENL